MSDYRNDSNDGCLIGIHEYAEKICPKCGHVFCWSCCANTNVHEGGKYAPTFKDCPQCGHDYYLE